MCHGDTRHFCAIERFIDELPDFLVVRFDPCFKEFRTRGIAITHRASAHVTLSQIRHGADAKQGLTLFVTQDKDLLFRGFARDKVIHRFKQCSWGFEKTLRIVVSCRNDNGFHRGALQAMNPAVVELLGFVRGKRSVENIPGNQKHVGLTLIHKRHKVINKMKEIFSPIHVPDRLAEMPICGMKNSQRTRH